MKQEELLKNLTEKFEKILEHQIYMMKQNNKLLEENLRYMKENSELRKKLEEKQ